jgi:hypothetical protein
MNWLNAIRKPSAAPHDAPQTVQSEKRAEPAAVGSDADPTLRLHTTLFDLGNQRALDRGSPEPDAREIEVLTEHARAMAREAAGAEYNPETNPDDRMREQAHAKDLHDRGDIELALKHAEARLRDREEEAGKHPLGEEPCPPPVAVYLIAAIISVSCWPSLHDMLVAVMKGGMTTWIASGVVSFVIGYGVAWCMIETYRWPSSATWAFAGLLGGIGVGIALALVRLSVAEGSGEIILCLGLTILELSAVVLGEVVGRAIRREYGLWKATLTLAEKAQSEVDAATRNRDQAKRALDEVNSKIEAHTAYVTRRARHWAQREALEAAAVKAVVDGYHAGLAAVRKKLIGIR